MYAGQIRETDLVTPRERRPEIVGSNRWTPGLDMAVWALTKLHALEGDRLYFLLNRELMVLKRALGEWVGYEPVRSILEQQRVYPTLHSEVTATELSTVLMRATMMH